MKKFPLQESVKITKEIRKGGILSFVLGLILFSLISNLVISVKNMVSFGNDMNFIIQLFSYIILSLTIIIYSIFVERRNLRSLGFKLPKFTKNYLFGLLIGFSMITAIFLLSLASNSFSVLSTSINNWIYLIVVFIAFGIQGFSEELLFKGYFMTSMSSMSNVPIGIITNSLLFAVNHAINPNATLLSLFNIFLLGLFLSLIFFYFDNLFIAAAIHSAWNFFMYFLGVPVSGTLLTNSIFTSKLTADKKLLNGGEFGFEGGLLATIVLALSIIAILYFIKKKMKSYNEVLKIS